MFGLSLSKILLTALVIWLVWMLFKRIGGVVRQGAVRPSPAERARAAAEEVTRRQSAETEKAAGVALELQACPSCGSYGTPGSTCHCGYKHPPA